MNIVIGICFAWTEHGVRYPVSYRVFTTLYLSISHTYIDYKSIMWDLWISTASSRWISNIDHWIPSEFSSVKMQQLNFIVYKSEGEYGENTMVPIVVYIHLQYTFSKFSILNIKKKLFHSQESWYYMNILTHDHQLEHGEMMKYTYSEFSTYSTIFHRIFLYLLKKLHLHIFVLSPSVEIRDKNLTKSINL